MTKFLDTDAAANFIASADSRETSPEVMRAIAFFARTADEAEAIWSGLAHETVCHLADIWEHATGNGRLDDSDLFWGGRTLAAVMAEAAADAELAAHRAA